MRRNKMIHEEDTQMRRNKTFLVAGVLLLMFILTGCGAKKPQKAFLTLESNPTTGYQWIVEQDPEIFDISSEYKEDTVEGTTEQMVGVGGKETFTLTPKKEGSTEINFLYKQPWDEESLYTRLSYQIKVDKNMQIQVESSSGQMGEDISEVPEMPEFRIE